MAQPFDVTTRRLFERDPHAWLALAGFTAAGSLAPVDPGLPTLGATADKVVRVSDPAPWLFHLEIQASYERDLPWRLLHYNALLAARRQ